MNKFKVGDTVRKTSGAEKGHKGIVEKVMLDGINVSEYGFSSTRYLERWELVAYKFKVGDKIECINMVNTHTNLIKIGGTYTIKSIDCEWLHLEGIDSRWTDTQFKLAKTKVSEPKYGDRVVLTNTDVWRKISYKKGQTAVLTEAINGFEAKLDSNGEIVRLWRSEFELLADTEETLGSLRLGLKRGQNFIVECRNGRVYLMVNGEIALNNKSARNRMLYFENYNQDLTDKVLTEWDIVKVHILVSTQREFMNGSTYRTRSYWKRGEVQEMTMAQINKHFNKTIKIVEAK